ARRPASARQSERRRTCRSGRARRLPVGPPACGRSPVGRIPSCARSWRHDSELPACHPTPVFHVELRQFPHVARTFNLTREQLDGRITRRWVQGQQVELDDRRWAPERARIAIYEGRALAMEEIGLGRGWANVMRMGEAVTDRVLAEARQ